MYKIGIDIGGMSIKAGLVDNGEIIDRLAKETDIQGGLDKLVEDITYLVNQLVSKNNISIGEIETIGIGFPGVVTNEGAVTCVNLGLKNALIVPKLKENFKNTTVKVGNDANVAALGEMWQGGGKGQKNMVMITLGTGVGSGFIVNGKLIVGEHGAGGEGGHVTVDYEETDCCGCGNKGCLEQYASATGIVRLAKKKLAVTEKTTVLNAETVTAKDVWDAVKAGDEVAIEVAEQFGKYLGSGLAIMAAVADPAIFVIGGGVSKAGDILLLQ